MTVSSRYPRVHAARQSNRFIARSVIRSVALAVSLVAFVAVCPSVIAETPTPSQTPTPVKTWPGRTVRTATALEGIFGLTADLGDPVPVYGMRGTLGVEGFFTRALVLETSIGYRWIDEGARPLPLPGGSLGAGYRHSLPGLFSITPLGALSLEAAFHEDGAKPALQLSGGARFAFLLDRGDYLTVTPSASVPLSGDLKSSISVSIGLRSENAWILPASTQRPRVTPSVTLMSPDGDGESDSTNLRLSVADRSLVTRWSLAVYGADGKPAKSWGDLGKPPRAVEWDGSLGDKETIEPGIAYRVSFETEDVFGRVDRGESSVTCDILVIKDGARYKVRVPDINFPSGSWELSPRESRNLLEANRKSLERVATIFSRFPDYALIVEGYANAVNWTDKRKFEEEQRKELLPLSQKRADSVKSALVMLGIDATRIRARGLGGSKPVAEFADARSVWKNRRVEFILEK